MKLTIDIYVLIKSLIGKILGHKNEPKNQLFGPILTIFNTSIKTVAYLMHHLACHHWSKFQTKLTTF